MQNDLTIVMYHYVRDLKHSRYPEIKGLDLKLFQKQIDCFKERYHFVSCEEVLEARYTNKILPKNSMLLTFDDGYIDHYNNVFPILKENHISAFFTVPGKVIAEHKVLDVNKIHFILASTPVDKLLSLVFKYLDYYRGKEYEIPPNKDLYEKLTIEPSRFDTPDVVFIKLLLQVELEESLRNQMTDKLFQELLGVDEETFSKELYMSYKQVELMKCEGMYFGIHGYDHYWLDSLTVEEAKQDTLRALDVFGNVIDKNAWIFCYPYGPCNNDSIIKMGQELGAVAGLTAEPRVANLDNDDIMRLPRLDTNDFLRF